MNIKKPGLILKLPKLLKFLSKIDIHPGHFIIPGMLALLAAFFEIVSVSALIPLVKGVIFMDFIFVKKLPVIRDIFMVFPDVFTRNAPIFILLLSTVFLGAALKSILQYISSLIVAKHVRRASNNMRKMIFSRYLSFGKLFFDRNSVGHLYNVLLTSTTIITERVKSVEGLLNSLFLLLGYLTVMFIIYWKLTLALILIIPLLNYGMRLLINKIRKTSAMYASSYSSLGINISNILSCIPLVKLYSNENAENINFSKMSDQIERIEFSMDKKNNLIYPLQEIILLGVVLLVVMALTFFTIKEKTIQIATCLVYFYILRMCYKQFGIFNMLKGNLAMVAGPISAISGILDDNDKFFVTGGRREFKGLEKSIEFRNLTFFYKKGFPVLKDISFSIDKGSLTAIVGPTGAGKTSLINLILRFYDCPESSIFIDGIDIKEFTLDSLRTHIALVSQDTMLFNDTLENNIVYGLKGPVIREKIMDAVKKAGLYDFVMNLPKGLDTYIGDRGLLLSGGEKQRVAIARALLKEAQILILDEATSSLDTKTEKFIQEGIAAAVQDRTAIVIAHRLSTIKNAGKIIVIENGRLIEQGGLEELLGKKGKFFEYWQEQKFY